MIYLLLVNITLTLCYLLYALFIKRLTFFQLNRLYLLGAVLLSLVIPIGLFIDISAFGIMEKTVPSLEIPAILADDFLLANASNAGFSIGELLHKLYWTGVLLAGAWMLLRLLYACSLIKRKRKDGNFSFFHQVVLREKGEASQSIFEHEQVHVRQGHSYDIMLLELVRVFNWFNPIWHSYLKEIKFQHECIADECCAEDKVAYAELLVAQAMHVESAYFIHEFSNKSILKNRIMMLFKDKSKKRSKWLYFSFAPIALLAIFSTLIFNTSKAKELVQEFDAKVEETTFKATSVEKRDPKNKVELLTATTAQPKPEEKGTSDKFSAVTINKAALQDTIERVLTQEELNRVFTETEIMPEPVNGMAKFRLWVAQNYKYPQAAIDAGVVGKISVTFIVERDGSLSNFKIIEDQGHDTGQALIETLSKANNWRPGIQNGRKVRVMFQIPMSIDLSQ